MTCHQNNFFYIPQINELPTASSVVAETLNNCLKIKEETNQKDTVATKDLAIATTAWQIQNIEVILPQYDEVFIQLGGFHIQMAYFRAVKKYINESGCTQILVEA